MIRARFAPSPTGYLHVGSARTALFNWLFCRSVGGRLVLRIEDTDRARNQSELVDNILEVLTWLGIDWDEGPFFQSARAERHREVVDQLVAAGAAYLDEGAVRFRVPDGRRERLGRRGAGPGRVRERQPGGLRHPALGRLGRCSCWPTWSTTPTWASPT